MTRIQTRPGYTLVVGNNLVKEDGKVTIPLDAEKGGVGTNEPYANICQNVEVEALIEALIAVVPGLSYEKPRGNIREQVLALPVGTQFLIRELSMYRGVKVTDTHYISLSNGQPYASPITHMRTDVDHEVVVEFDPQDPDRDL